VPHARLPVITNEYGGYRIALWMLWIVLVVRLAQIASVTVNARAIIIDADGIPLDAFSPAATETVVATFLGMAISRLLICLICAAILWRYRSAIVPVFSLLALHDIARELVLGPVRVGRPVGPYVNWVLIGMILAGVLLAARTRPPEGRGVSADDAHR
jgi:hypothetical protein